MADSRTSVFLGDARSLAARRRQLRRVGLNGWKIVRMGVKPYYNRFKLYITVVDPRKESATWESTGSQEGYWDAHKAGYAQRLLRWFEANSCFAGLRAMKKYNDMTRKER